MLTIIQGTGWATKKTFPVRPSQTIKPPNLPPAPANWEMPRTHDGKPDFTGVYAGPGFNHQIGKNDTDTAIFRGFDAKIMPPTKPGGDAILFKPVTGNLEASDTTPTTVWRHDRG